MKKGPEPFCEEREILRRLGDIQKLSGENIITLLTCYSWQDHIYLIFPDVQSDLYRQLNGEGAIHDLPKVCSDEPLPENWLWEQMVGVSEGLSTIHTGIQYTESGSGQVIVSHFDLKPANILLTADRKLKITDFGRSFIEIVADKSEAYCNSGDPVYQPPESKPMTHEMIEKLRAEEMEAGRDGLATSQQNYDVWSLACIMVEVLVYIFDRSDPIQEEPPLELFKMNLKTENVPNCFVNDRLYLKSCVNDMLKEFRGHFEHEAAHHQYITEVTHLLTKMFHRSPYHRLPSSEVHKSLQDAKVTYENTLRTQGDPLADEVRGYRGSNEVGWINDSNSIVSYAEM